MKCAKVFRHTPKMKMPSFTPEQMRMMIAMEEQKAKENAKYERERKYLFAQKGKPNEG